MMQYDSCSMNLENEFRIKTLEREIDRYEII